MDEVDLDFAKGAAPEIIGTRGCHARVSFSYDAIIIIGTVQAGPSLAGRSTAAGVKVAIVERGRFGGTRVNTMVPRLIRREDRDVPDAIQEILDRVPWRKERGGVS